MRAPRSCVLAVATAAFVTVAWPVRGGDAATDLESGLRELEGLVRELHGVRAHAAQDLDRARTNAARVEAEARDLERDAAAIEEEGSGLRDSVARLEGERRDLEARRGALLAARVALAKAVGDESGAPGVAAGALRKLRDEAAAAGACSADGDSVHVGTIRFERAAEPGHAIADQLERRAPPGLVRVRWSLDGLERP